MNVRRIVVCGPRGSGKTTTLLGMRDAWAHRGLRVGGVVQLVRIVDELRVGYDLMDVGDGETRPIARRRMPPLEEGLGFDFDDAAWVWARERILEARRHADVLVIDELGRLEARGGGHVAALRAPVAEERCRIWLLGVREGFEAEIASLVGEFAEVHRLPARSAPA
jgi:nucleoside-triphosphatase THEP1